jgi:hypothetical protein
MSADLCTLGWVNDHGQSTHHECRGGQKPDARAICRVSLPAYVAMIDGQRVPVDASGPFNCCAEHLALGLRDGIFDPGVVSPTHSPNLCWQISSLPDPKAT